MSDDLTWADHSVALLCEMENLIDALSDQVERVAFSMKPPNPYTPQLIQAVADARRAVNQIKARGLDAAGDLDK